VPGEAKIYANEVCHVSALPAERKES
jgi:hypothetical protein